MKNHNVCCIYSYGGPEAPLGDALVTVTDMTIDFLEVANGVAKAEGMFNIMDHVEGFPASNSWTAKGVQNGDKIEWTVRRMLPGLHGCCFVSKEGEPLFTLVQSVNDSIKLFITTKLNYVVDELEKNPSASKIEEMPKVFEGIIHEYVGKCVCKELRASGPSSPFNWNDHTNNGQYPKSCFKCSCGQRWYRGKNDMWAHVGDDETWTMLTTHDGQVVECLTLDPEKRTVPTVTLLRKLRARGFIPI